MGKGGQKCFRIGPIEVSFNLMTFAWVFASALLALAQGLVAIARARYRY